jgi:1,4-alpha-glucan branching enzyme
MRVRITGMICFIVAMIVAAQAQYDPSKVCRVEDGKLIFMLNKDWTRTQKLEVAQLFDLDTTLVLDIYDGRHAIKAGTTTWQVATRNSGWVELSKPLGQASSPTGTGNVVILDDKWINAEGIQKREEEALGINKFTYYKVFNYHSGVATFYLPKQTQASQVFLSGTFNNWGTQDTPMKKTDSGWVVSIRLTPGQYLYKYIIDGKWTQDPYNYLKEDDWNGGFNSVVFCYNYRFSLNGFNSAKKVVLSGSFNFWNDHALPMVRVPGGWALYLYLREGTHAYKFVVDGQWILDPSNPVVRTDGAGNKNSFMSIGDTFYFRLNGKQDIKAAFVAGNFNVWNGNELPMKKTGTGWELPYVLAPGNYQYKFILDGNWITDPDNPYLAVEGGFKNSLLLIKPNFTFVLEGYPDAKTVIATGTFSGWSHDNYPMVKREGKWMLPLFLRPGKYSYRFIVDGKWMEDPANDQWETNEYGSKNSVLWIEP